MSDLSASSERAVRLALRAGQYRELLRAIVDQYGHTCREQGHSHGQGDEDCPIYRAAKHLEENQ